MAKLGVAVIGTGNIAERYVDDLKTYPEVDMIGVTDIDAKKVADFAHRHQVETFANNESLLRDERVEVVVNLTPHFAHHVVTEQALNAGKHVYSEKPLALRSEDAWHLVKLAQENNVRLACSPFTMIGEAQQTAWKLIRDGKLGEIRVIYGEVNWGRIEAWHPAPVPFYEVGAMADVGVYVLAIVTSFFGPVTRIFSHGKTVMPDRQTNTGQPFSLSTPDWMLHIIELANGIQLRLTTDFYVSNGTTRQTGIEFHGDLGSLHLEEFSPFNSAVSFAKFGDQLQPVPLLREAAMGVPWGRGIHELVRAILEDRPHRFSGEQAAHICDILDGSTESMKTGKWVEINTSFPPPEPADWVT